jgi:hypothetical protein
VKPPTVLVLAAGLPFVRLEAIMAGLGWSGGPLGTLPPLLAGEPELARWRRAIAVADYDFDPVSRLRRLTLIGAGPPERGALSAALPLLDAADVAALLRSAADEAVLRGILAADALRLRDLRDELTRIAAGPDDVLAPAAAAVAERLENHAR